MSSNQPTNLRRSTRTVIPTTPFTIDNSPPPLKRKKMPIPSNNVPVATTTVPQTNMGPPASFVAHITETRRIDRSIQRTVNENRQMNRTLAPCTENGVPLTMYSNKSLDSILNQESPEDGVFLQQRVEELRERGMNITVKQLLAKNFKNYKVRQSLTSERATEIVNRTLSENDVPQGAMLSGPPMIPPTVRLGTIYQQRKTRTHEYTLQNSLESLVANAPEPDPIWRVAEPVKSEVVEPIQQTPVTLQSALASLVGPKEETMEHGEDQTHTTKTESPKLTDAELGLDEFATHILSSPHNKSTHCDLDPIAYPGNHLPWQVIWKQVPQYTQGEIYCHVGECIYTPMSEIIKSGNFMVPMDQPIAFIYNERPIEVTLDELLTANGINLFDTQHYRMLQGLLQKAGVHIRADYAERLHELQAMKDRGMQLNCHHTIRPPIQLSPDKLPLMCIYPDIYMKALGRRIHGAVIVDTSGDKEPLPGQTFLTTIYSEPLPFDLRRQILILHDTEIPIDHISRRFGCTIRSIQETIGTRILIERHLVEQHLLEDPKSTSSQLSSPPQKTTAPSPNLKGTLGEMMRPKSKIRRTHYVDLNKLVWKHFKDCQASGVQINGKHLKDQAMRYAKEMGLESFRGSEGWLDAFKRRHRIDLKTMTGYPVCYENDMYDEVDKECRELDMESQHHHLNHLNHHQTPSFFPHGNSGNSAPDEFAASFFSSLGGFPQQMVATEPSPTTHLQTMINMMTTPPTTSSESSSSRMMPSTSSGSQQDSESSSGGGGDTIFNVMRSCQIKVADKEVSHALDTLRTYILAHDPAAMSLLVPLQERLASTSSGAIGVDMSGTSSSSS